MKPRFRREVSCRRQAVPEGHELADRLQVSSAAQVSGNMTRQLGKAAAICIIDVEQCWQHGLDQGQAADTGSEWRGGGHPESDRTTIGMADEVNGPCRLIDTVTKGGDFFRQCDWKFEPTAIVAIAGNVGSDHLIIRAEIPGQFVPLAS